MAGFTTTTTETWRTWEEEYTYGPDEDQMDDIAYNANADWEIRHGSLSHQYTHISTTLLGEGASAYWCIDSVDGEWGSNMSPIPNSECPIPNDPVVTFEQKPHSFQTSPGSPYPHCTVNLIPQPAVRTFDKSTESLSGGSCKYKYRAKVERTFTLLRQPYIGNIECDGTTCVYSSFLGGLFGQGGYFGKTSWAQKETLYEDFGTYNINTIKYTNKYLVDNTSNGTCFWERCACSDFGFWNTQQACAAATTNGVIYADHPKCVDPGEGSWSVNAAGKPCMFTKPGVSDYFNGPCCWAY
jgi:hypothetical protein